MNGDHLQKQRWNPAASGSLSRGIGLCRLRVQFDDGIAATPHISALLPFLKEEFVRGIFRKAGEGTETLAIVGDLSSPAARSYLQLPQSPARSQSRYKLCRVYSS